MIFLLVDLEEKKKNLGNIELTAIVDMVYSFIHSQNDAMQYSNSSIGNWRTMVSKMEYIFYSKTTLLILFKRF